MRFILLELRAATIFSEETEVIGQRVKSCRKTDACRTGRGEMDLVLYQTRRRCSRPRARTSSRIACKLVPTSPMKSIFFTPPPAVRTHAQRGNASDKTIATATKPSTLLTESNGSSSRSNTKLTLWHSPRLGLRTVSAPSSR